MDIRSRITPPLEPVLPGKPLPSATDTAFRTLDRAKEASLARMTGGVSPAAMTLAFSDWLIHLASAPGKRMELTGYGGIRLC
jgi:polyhydroxyalkanoate synthase